MELACPFNPEKRLPCAAGLEGEYLLTLQPLLLLTWTQWQEFPCNFDPRYGGR